MQVDGPGQCPALGSPMPALVLLIALKATMDLTSDRFKNLILKRR
jgi:hypothetical protein